MPDRHPLTPDLRVVEVGIEREANDFVVKWQIRRCEGRKWYGE